MDLGGDSFSQKRLSTCDYFSPLNFDREQNVLYANYENPFQPAMLSVLKNLKEILGKDDLTDFKPLWSCH